MKYFKLFFLVIVFGFCLNINATEPFINTAKSSENIVLKEKNVNLSIFTNPGIDNGILRAVKNLQSDFQNVTGTQPSITNQISAQQSPIIIVGTVGTQSVIDGLIKQKKIDGKSLVGKREKFIIQNVSNPFPFDVVAPLYEPSQKYEFGKSTWSWILWQDESMNEKDQKTFIDLASSLNYQFILIDALWDKNIGKARMKELIDYAKSKNVNVLLWYNSNGAANDAPMGPRNKMNSAIERKKEMKWLKEVGVKGLKVDFFGGDKQETMKLYEDILSDANDFGLAIIFHGATLPRGWEVMFPNYAGSEAVLASEMLYFSEGIRKQEAFFATLHPFIRNTVGSMEFGGTFLNKYLTKSNKDKNQRLTTDAFQLATAVLFQNPIQMFGVMPNNLTDAPKFQLDFMKTVPTLWDDTQFIDGYPGKYSVVARRHQNQWYVAGVNAEKTVKKLKLNLPMMAGQTIKFINDDAKGNSSEKEVKVNAKGDFNVDIQPNGGFVLRN